MKFKVQKKELKNLNEKKSLNAQHTRLIGGGAQDKAPDPITNTSHFTFQD
ncbi:hypothetical protein [Pseudoalteromonas ardens]|nr:hypothetical protein [Pseudoalteromonas sp. R96]MDK1313851.1 hypothetical protein [Pseudoalteromonas sp. R96]